MNLKNLAMRRTRLEDIPFIAARCCEEVPKLPVYRNVSVNAKHLEYVLSSNINNDGYLCSWVLYDEDDGYIYGGIAAYCIQLMYSPDKCTGDIFMFIREDARSLPNAVKLIRAYKDWAIARGAKLITATHTSGLRAEGMDRLLQHEGFEPIGTLYHLRRD